MSYTDSQRSRFDMTLSQGMGDLSNVFITGAMETTTSVSFSIPLFQNSPRSLSLSSSYNHSNNGGDRYQTTLDSNGFILVPSITPYRYNNISIVPEEMKENAEVLDGQKRVVPVA